MNEIVQLSKALLANDLWTARAIAKVLGENPPSFKDFKKPNESDDVIILSAALICLLADRNNQLPPDWINCIKGFSRPYILGHRKLTSKSMTFLRSYSSEKLRQFNILASDEFLTSR